MGLAVLAQLAGQLVLLGRDGRPSGVKTPGDQIRQRLTQHLAHHGLAGELRRRAQQLDAPGHGLSPEVIGRNREEPRQQILTLGPLLGRDHHLGPPPAR